jgi:HAD superfamily hydrolase (TIGR01549 family)
MPIKAVFFDLGETLLDETRMWREWADYMGVSERDFTAALEQIIARGEHHHRAFELLQPGFDPRAAQLTRVADGTRYLFRPDDLYPDAKACLTALRSAGFFVGIAGNQSRDLLDSMLALNLDVDVITTSEHLGFDKPSPKFFEGLLAQTGFRAAEAAYVGDRIDNDILPAKAVGMTTAFLKRGPWGRAHAGQSAAADIRLETLVELPDALERLRQNAEARSPATTRAQN